MHSTRTFALLVLCLAACSRTEAPAQRSPEASKGDASGAFPRVRVDPALIEKGRIVTAVVEHGQGAEGMRVPGEVQSDEQGRAEVGALTAARIVSLEAGVGARVTKGQVLAWLDAPEVARLSADLIRARARQEVAARKEQRQATLAANQATSQNALDDAHAEAQTAQADVSALRSLLRSLGSAEAKDQNAVVSRIALRSPVDGTISACHAPVGAALSPEKSLFELVTRGHSVVIARLADGATAAPSAGTTARLVARNGESGASCEGHVVGDLGVVDSQSRTRALRIAPSAGCNWLTPGAFVEVQIAGLGAASPSTHGLSVSRDALVDLKGLSGVFVALRSPGEFEFRPLQSSPGAANTLEVQGGLVRGDVVAVVGAGLLKGELLRKELAE